MTSGTSLVRRDVEGYYRKQLLRTAQLQFRSNKRHNNELKREIRHLERGKRIRERELDQEETRYLDKLISLFQKRCEIALEKSETEETFTYNPGSPVSKLFAGLKEKAEREEYERTVKAARMNRPGTAPPTCGIRTPFRGTINGFRTPSPHPKPNVAWSDLPNGNYISKTKETSNKFTNPTENGFLSSGDENEGDKVRTEKKTYVSPSPPNYQRRGSTGAMSDKRIHHRYGDRYRYTSNQSDRKYRAKNKQPRIVLGKDDMLLPESPKPNQSRPDKAPNEPTAIIFVHVYPEDELNSSTVKQQNGPGDTETTDIKAAPQIKAEVVKRQISVKVEAVKDSPRVTKTQHEDATATTTANTEDITVSENVKNALVSEDTRIDDETRNTSKQLDSKTELVVKFVESDQNDQMDQRRPASAAELRRGQYRPNLKTIEERHGNLKPRPKTAIPKYGGRSSSLQATSIVTSTPIPSSAWTKSTTASPQNKPTNLYDKYERRHGDRYKTPSPSPSPSPSPTPQTQPHTWPKTSNGVDGQTLTDTSRQRSISCPDVSQTNRRPKRRPHTAVQYEHIHSKMMRRLLYTQPNHDKKTRLLFARVQSTAIKQLSDHLVPPGDSA
ncbi:uncharacterized protein LOC144441204 [Glandiceps talaboti]